MPLTPTQTQILKSHIVALRAASAASAASKDLPEFTPKEVVASMCYELGPFIMPIIADRINHIANPPQPPNIAALEAMLTTLDTLEDELMACKDGQNLPTRRWKEIIAQLFDKFGPYIIELLISVLLEPEPKPLPQYTPKSL